MNIRIWIFVLVVMFGYGINLGHGFWGGMAGLLLGLLALGITAGTTWLIRRYRSRASSR